MSDCFVRVSQGSNHLVQVPQQQNGFDCGVYTVIFAERIFDKMMPSREEDIRSRFKEYDLNENINQQEVDVKRTTIRSLLDKYAASYHALSST